MADALEVNETKHSSGFEIVQCVLGRNSILFIVLLIVFAKVELKGYLIKTMTAFNLDCIFK